MDNVVLAWKGARQFRSIVEDSKDCYELCNDIFNIYKNLKGKKKSKSEVEEALKPVVIHFKDLLASIKPIVQFIIVGQRENRRIGG